MNNRRGKRLVEMVLNQKSVDGNQKEHVANTGKMILNYEKFDSTLKLAVPIFILPSPLILLKVLFFTDNQSANLFLPESDMTSITIYESPTGNIFFLYSAELF